MLHICGTCKKEFARAVDLQGTHDTLSTTWMAMQLCTKTSGNTKSLFVYHQGMQRTKLKKMEAHIREAGYTIFEKLMSIVASYNSENKL